MILGHGHFFGVDERRRETGGVVLASLVARLPEHEVERHTHEDAHFVYVLAGTYLASAAGAPGAAGTPTLIYNPPGTTHRDRFLSARGRFFTVSLDRARLASAAQESGLPDRAVWLGQPAALSAVARLAGECVAWDTASPLAVDGLLWTLTGATAGTPGLGLGPARWLRRVRDRLHDDCARPLRLGALASDAGVHPGHLTRSFRRAFGCTPGEYQRACRAERARSLLAGGRLPLAVIAARSGYSDQSHMTRALRRHLGLTPARARRFVSF